MAGTTSSYSSNLDLALSAAPQGVYDPRTQSDVDGLHFSTQSLSSTVSDAVTVRILFLVAVSAGKFIRSAVNPNEAIGILAGVGNITIGFLNEDVAAGDYAVVYSSGINSSLTGLLPGRDYYLDSNGGVTATPTFPAVRVGFAINPTLLVVQNIGWIPA